MHTVYTANSKQHTAHCSHMHCVGHFHTVNCGLQLLLWLYLIPPCHIHTVDFSLFEASAPLVFGADKENVQMKENSAHSTHVHCVVY